MKINEVCKKTGVSKDNLRFYEKEGLIHPMRDESNNYREYGEQDIILLEKIKLLRSLGIPINDIRQVISGDISLETAASHRLEGIAEEREHLKLVQRICTHLYDEKVSFEELDVDGVVDAEPDVKNLIRDVLRADTAEMELSFKEFDKVILRINCIGYMTSAALLLALGQIIGHSAKDLYNPDFANSMELILLGVYAGVTVLLCFLQMWSSRVSVQAIGAGLSALTIGPALWSILAMFELDTNKGIWILLAQILFVLAMYYMRRRSEAFVKGTSRPLIISVIFCALEVGLIITMYGAGLYSYILAIIISICILISGMGWAVNGSSGQRLTVFAAVVTASRMLAVGTIGFQYFGNQNSWRRTPDEPKWFKG